VYKDFVKLHQIPTSFEFKAFFEGDPSLGNLTDKAFEYLTSQLEDSKSPGSPLVYVANNNKTLKANHIASFRFELQRSLVRLQVLGSDLYKVFQTDKRLFSELFAQGGASFDTHRNIAVNLLKAGLSEPVLCKRKGEMRKLGKRPRLVNMVSALTNSLLRLAIGDAMLLEQTNGVLPIAVALDLVTPEKTNAMWQEFSNQGKLHSSDVEGWEYCVRPEIALRPLLKWAYSMKLTDINFEWTGNDFGRLCLLIALYYCDMHKVVQTECGNLVVIPPGVVTSGILSTFTDSSEKRASMSNDAAIYCGSPLRYVKTAGDDCLDTLPLGVDYFHRIGVKITDEVIQEGEYDFCSTKFRLDGTYQVNIEKFISNLLYSINDSDVDWFSKSLPFESIFGNHPDYARYADIIKRARPNSKFLPQCALPVMDAGVKLTKILMPRNRKSQAKSKKAVTTVVVKQAAPAKRNPTQPSSKVPHSFVEKVCSRLDPFCPAAVGSRQLDSGNLRTIAYPFKYRATLQSSGANVGSTLWLPGYGIAPFWAGTMASPPTAVWTTIPTTSYLGSNVNAFRIVSAGVLIKNICAPLNCSGMVRIKSFNITSGNAMGSVDCLTFNASKTMDIPLQDCKEVAVVLARTDSSQAVRFFSPTAINPDNNINNYLSPGWEALVIAVDGVPSNTNVLDLEYFFNLEVVIGDNDALQLMAAPTPKDAPLLKSITDEVGSSMVTMFKEGAKGAAKFVAKAAIDYVGTRITGRSAGPQYYLKDVD